MNIEINRPELEALIQKRLQSGVFDSIEEILFRALEAQDEREDWLQNNKEASNDKIELAMAQFDLGEGIPGEQLPARLDCRYETQRRPRTPSSRTRRRHYPPIRNRRYFLALS